MNVLGFSWQHFAIGLAAIVSVTTSHWRLSKKIAKFTVEHEMLIDLLCDITGKKRSDLPTRHNGVL